MSSDSDGVRYELLLTEQHATRLVYEGTLSIGEQQHPVRVEVLAAPESAAGWRVQTHCPSAPEGRRAALETTAGIMVRSAVRRARNHGLAPPRRVRRWRPLPRARPRRP